MPTICWYSGSADIERTEDIAVAFLRHAFASFMKTSSTEGAGGLIVVAETSE